MSYERRSNENDYILVGGGLQSGLLCLALQHHQPHARVLLIERAAKLAGNHTWSFHPGDVPETCRPWVEPLMQHVWPSYEVRIGTYRREVELAYASVPATHLAKVVAKRIACKSQPIVVGVGTPGVPPPGFSSESSMDLETSKVFESSMNEVSPEEHLRILTGTEVAKLGHDHVITTLGEVYHGRLVIDCRGPASIEGGFAGCGFQKFWGFELELDQDWPFDVPVVMDASSDQSDGFRFVYSLPFSSRRVLVEDTRFSDSRDLDHDECFEHVALYLKTLGIDQFKIVRKESGILPMPFSDEMRPSARNPLAGGYAGGWFHAATGYSFPMAVGFAEAVARVPPEQAPRAIANLAASHQWRSHYSRFLNRLLFRLVAPRWRHRIFRRFYRVLDEAAIERFYSHRFLASDAFRIVMGIPPTLIGLRPWRFMRSFLRGDK